MVGLPVTLTLKPAPAGVNDKLAVRRNEIVFVGHRLSQFPEQGEFSPVAGVFGLDRILPAVFTLLYRRKTGGWRPGDL